MCTFFRVLFHSFFIRFVFTIGLYYNFCYFFSLLIIHLVMLINLLSWIFLLFCERLGDLSTREERRIAAREAASECGASRGMKTNGDGCLKGGGYGWKVRKWHSEK